ncbi:hypothetical protein BDW68DRAFT_62507 [Aspergillus falconensis]
MVMSPITAPPGRLILCDRVPLNDESFQLFVKSPVSCTSLCLVHRSSISNLRPHSSSFSGLCPPPPTNHHPALCSRRILPGPGPTRTTHSDTARWSHPPPSPVPTDLSRQRQVVLLDLCGSLALLFCRTEPWDPVLTFQVPSSIFHLTFSAISAAAQPRVAVLES